MSSRSSTTGETLRPLPPRPTPKNVFFAHVPAGRLDEAEDKLQEAEDALFKEKALSRMAKTKLVAMKAMQTASSLAHQTTKKELADMMQMHDEMHARLESREQQLAMVEVRCVPLTDPGAGFIPAPRSPVLADACFARRRG